MGLRNVLKWVEFIPGKGIIIYVWEDALKDKFTTRYVFDNQKESSSPFEQSCNFLAKWQGKIRK